MLSVIFIIMRSLLENRLNLWEISWKTELYMLKLC